MLDCSNITLGYTEGYHKPFHSQEWSISNCHCTLTRNITLHSMKNLAFHSLIRWMMIILPILTTSLVIKRLGECTFWTWEWKAAVVLTQISAYSMHKNLAVPKVMEAMHTAYVKKRDSASTGLKNMMQTIMEHYTSMWKESVHRLLLFCWVVWWS